MVFNGHGLERRFEALPSWPCGQQTSEVARARPSVRRPVRRGTPAKGAGLKTVNCRAAVDSQAQQNSPVEHRSQAYPSVVGQIR
jgi:hypothetical protein